MAVFQLLYVSGATRAMTGDDLDDILETSRRNNAGRDVTGVLLYAEDTFIQVLEGERSVVQALARRIRGDGRHRNFMVLVEREAEIRAFGAWQMAFKRLDPSRASDNAVFELSREALAKRMAGDEGGMMLDTILAFAGNDFVQKAG